MKDLLKFGTPLIAFVLQACSGQAVSGYENIGSNSSTLQITASPSGSAIVGTNITLTASDSASAGAIFTFALAGQPSGAMISTLSGNSAVVSSNVAGFVVVSAAEANGASNQISVNFTSSPTSSGTSAGQTPSPTPAPNLADQVPVSTPMPASPSISPPSCSAVLLPGQSLSQGQSISTCDRKYELILQGDGNLVIYVSGGSPVWSTSTGPLNGTTPPAGWYGGTGTQAIMQNDGNFVLYNNGTPTFSTRTQGYPGAFLALQEDSNLVVYIQPNPPAAPTALWSWITGNLVGR